MQKYLTIMAVAVIAVAVPIISLAYKKPKDFYPEDKELKEKEKFLYL
jgi:hypothetical protein